jgi:hypothetical protein
MSREGNERPWGLGALALLLSSLSLAACGGDDEETTSTAAPAPGSSGLSVEVEPESAAAGDTVEAVVVNDTDEQFTYGAAYELEAEAGGTWERVELPVEPIPEIGYVAPPGGAGPPVSVDLPKDLDPGTHRVVIRRNVPGVGDLSGELEVIDGP